MPHFLSHKKMRERERERGDAQQSQHLLGTLQHHVWGVYNFPILPTRFPLALIGFCALCYTVFPHSSHISHFLWIISRERFNMVWRKCPSGETVPQESDLLLIFSMATNHNARNMRRTKIRWFLSWGPIWLQEIWSHTFFSFSDHLYILP